MPSIRTVDSGFAGSSGDEFRLREQPQALYAKQRRKLLILALTAFIICGCGAQATDVAFGAPSSAVDESVEFERRTVGGIIEPRNALVSDFGSGWTEVTSWYVEAHTEVASGCQAWDTLAKIDDRGGNSTAWVTGEAELTHRVTSLSWTAASYVELAEKLPDLCTRALIADESVTFDRIEPFSQEAVEGFTISAYPRFSEANVGQDPSLDPDHSAWLVYVVRDNVVSRLAISSAGGVDRAEVERLTSIMIEQLESAPYDLVGPVDPPEGPPSFEPQIFENVSFSLGSPECSDSGEVQAGGAGWRTNDSAPPEWRNRNVVGDLSVDGTSGTFTSEDGSTMAMTTGFVQASCSMWADPRVPPATFIPTIGRLECNGGVLKEERVLDDGQDPGEIARSASDLVVKVEAGEPLFWYGQDASGEVIVAVALGDDVDADYRIFTCGE